MLFLHGVGVAPATASESAHDNLNDVAVEAALEFLHDVGVAPATASESAHDNLNDVAVEAALEAAPPQLEQDDFPQIKFWFRRDWSTRGDNDLELKIFVETEDGNIVSETRMDDIRKYARNLWEIFLDEGTAPPRWGEAKPHISQRFRRLMCAQFPELRFCDNNWKVDHIATLHYPSWYRYWVKMKSKKQKIRSRSVSRTSLFYRYLL